MSSKNESINSKLNRTSLTRGRQGRKLILFYFGLLGAILFLGMLGYHRMRHSNAGSRSVNLVQPAVSASTAAKAGLPPPGNEGVCPSQQTSLFYSNTDNTDDHRGGLRLTASGEDRISLKDRDASWKGQTVNAEHPMESTIDDLLKRNPTIFKPLRKERFLSPEISKGDVGGNAFFEEVTDGAISLAGDQKTNAVAWGDSKAPATWRDQKGFESTGWPRLPFKTVVKEYTPEELLAMHHTMDIVISYVNGSDPIHRFHKLVLNNIVPGLL
eukprot:PhF_6_TR29236/c0_g1_i1/m.42793